MDTITSYLDTPITPKEFLTSPIVWLTVLCSLLLYIVLYRKRPQIEQKIQGQNGGTGNTQVMKETRKIASDNMYIKGQNSDSSAIGMQVRRADGNSKIRVGKVTVTKVTLSKEEPNKTH